jgi:hypothetical protein
MTDDLLENAIVAAQDQYGDPPAKYAPGNNMPDSVTVAVHHQRATFNGVPLVEDRGHRLLEENRSVLPGNIADKATLRGFLERIEEQYGKARRVWLMDSGVPTEEVLAEMRAVDPPMHYLVGTPKGRLTRLEKHLVTKPWQQARPGVEVKLLAQEGELYVLAQSRDRVAKERAMRRRRLKRLWTRLKQLSTMALSREELLMKLGAAREQSRTAWRLVTIEIAADGATFSYRLDEPPRRQQLGARNGATKRDQPAIGGDLEQLQ